MEPTHAGDGVEATIVSDQIAIDHSRHTACFALDVCRCNDLAILEARACTDVARHGRFVEAANYPCVTIDRNHSNLTGAVRQVLGSFFELGGTRLSWVRNL